MRHLADGSKRKRAEGRKAVTRVLSRITGAIRTFVHARKLWAPRPAKIAVLHGSPPSVLLPLFGEHRYEVVYLDGEAMYVDPRILLSTLRHAIQIRTLTAAYAIAVLERIKPAIVVTYIDNSAVFQMAAQRVRSARFLAIQNGGRLLERDHPVGRSPQIYLREFACLGRYDIDQFSRHGARVETYYPIGSLKDAYYRAGRVKDAGAAKSFDLCLVAQFKPGARVAFTEGFEVLTAHLRRFCEAHHATLCVPLRGHPDADTPVYKLESEFFDSRLGGLAQRFPNVPGAYTSYRLVDESRVSIGMHTTVLREGFGRGNRILSCNYTGNSEYNFPVPGPWATDDPAYDVFEQRLLWLLRASDEEYTKACGDMPSYVLGYEDTMPTHVFLERLIADAVRGSAEPIPTTEMSRV